MALHLHIRHAPRSLQRTLIPHGIVARFLTSSNPKLPVIDALRLAVQGCGFDDLLTDGTVAIWATNLSANGVNVLGDFKEPTAHETLKKSGVRNLKLCQSVLEQAFPVKEPPTDRAVVDAQQERWAAVCQKVGALRAAGQWGELIPYLLEVLKVAETEDGLHPFYRPQLFQELAQCYFHTDELKKCLEANSTALSFYAEGKSTHKWMEAMHFQAAVYVSMGDYTMASVAYEMILNWASKPDLGDSPVIAMTARDLKLSAKAELGALKVRRGELKEAEALLSANLVEASKCNAFAPTLRTLRALVDCFEALGDCKRCLSVAERAVAWCEKHDKAGEAQALIPLVQHYRERASEQAAQ